MIRLPVSRLALIATLVACNVALRVALAGGPPNVKPVAFLSIFAGILDGPVSGLFVGYLTILVSDSYFGFDAGTVLRASLMGFVGLFGGLIWHSKERLRRWELAVGGFLLTAMFDIGTSVYESVLYGVPLWLSLLALYLPFLGGLGVFYPFGFAHEVTTAILMMTLGPSLVARTRNLLPRLQYSTS